MQNDLRYELKSLEAMLLYYKDLITSHSKHVEEASKKVVEAKKVLSDILKRRDEAPLLIKQTEIRIRAMKVQVSQISFRPAGVDPKVKKLLALKEKLRALEKEMGLS